MKNSAASSLTSAIQASSQRRSLEELAAEGKKHVRVVSAKKVMTLITAIVDDAIERETSRKTKQHRDKIIGDTKQQFDRVMKLQAEQEAMVARQREAADDAQRQLNVARTRIKSLSTDLEEERGENNTREARSLADYQERLSGLVAEYDAEIERLREERNDLTGSLQQRSEELTQATRRVADLGDLTSVLEERTARQDAEVKELTAALATGGKRIEEQEERMEKLSSLLTEEQERLAAASTELDVARVEIRDLMSAREEQEEKIAHLIRERDLRDAEIAHLEQGCGSREEEIERNRKIRREFEEEVERLALVRKDLEGKLIRLENERDEQQAVRRGLEQKSEDAAKDIAELIDRHRESIERFETASREHEAALSELSLNHNSAMDRLEQNHAEIEARADTLQSELTATTDRNSRLEAEREALLQRFEAEKGDLAGRQEKALADTHQRIDAIATERNRSRQQAEDALGIVKKRERALRRLQTRLAGLRESLLSRDNEIERLTTELDTVTKQLGQVRESSESSAVKELLGGIEELRTAITNGNGNGNGNSKLDGEALDSLLQSLGERDVKLESRVEEQMSQTLAEISRSVRAATAQPIEICGDATEVLVDRMFDQESEMESNLDAISVEELGGGEVITGNLERLKAARALSGKDEK